MWWWSWRCFSFWSTRRRRLRRANDCGEVTSLYGPEHLISVSVVWNATCLDSTFFSTHLIGGKEASAIILMPFETAYASKSQGITECDIQRNNTHTHIHTKRSRYNEWNEWNTQKKWQTVERRGACDMWRVAGVQWMKWRDKTIWWKSGQFGEKMWRARERARVFFTALRPIDFPPVQLPLPRVWIHL